MGCRAWGLNKHLNPVGIAVSSSGTVLFRLPVWGDTLNLKLNPTVYAVSPVPGFNLRIIDFMSDEVARTVS